MTLLTSAAHWERLADEEEKQAAWDRSHGLDLSRAGESCGDLRARLYRKVGRVMRLEAINGTVHCMCHELPRSRCPNG